uniref:VQ domain-containing protein n=1 Tax=Oryza brachyantha TaxID=4533 RepID=J3N720_ORYBR
MERYPRTPAVVITEPSPTRIYVTANPSTFKELVQRLTGQPTGEAVAQDGVAPATAAPPPAAPRRGSITMRRMATAVHDPPTFKAAAPRRPIIWTARPWLAGLASPTARSPSPSPSPYGPDGPCVLNKQGELPPSPPSVSTLAEEAMEDAAEEKDMQQSPPPLRAVRAREPKLLNLFPLTPLPTPRIFEKSQR